RTKVVLREATRGVIPESVRTRRDKMGFVTPEEVWVREQATPWFRTGLEAAFDAAPGLLDPSRTRAMFADVVAGRTPFDFAPWRVLCFGRWAAGLGSAARMAA